MYMISSQCFGHLFLLKIPLEEFEWVLLPICASQHWLLLAVEKWSTVYVVDSIPNKKRTREVFLSLDPFRGGTQPSYGDGRPSLCFHQEAVEPKAEGWLQLRCFGLTGK